MGAGASVGGLDDPAPSGVLDGGGSGLLPGPRLARPASKGGAPSGAGGTSTFDRGGLQDIVEVVGSRMKRRFSQMKLEDEEDTEAVLAMLHRDLSDVGLWRALVPGL